MNVNRYVNHQLFPVVSALAVVAAAVILKPSAALVSVYWAVAFWLLVGFDFYQSQVKEDGASELDSSKYSFADRFLGYLFAAPVIFPARAVRFAMVRSCR